MAIVTTDNKHYKAIADALRKYEPGFSYKPSAMADAVDAVRFSGELEGYQKGYVDGEAYGYESGYGIGYIDGTDDEHDRFWNSYQSNGTRDSYAYAFCRSGWNDDTFYPKYDIDATYCQYMFNGSAITNLERRLKECGVTLDTTNANTLYYFASNAKITHFPELGGSNVSNVENSFSNAENVVSIKKLTINRAKNCSFASAFINCKALEEIRFSDGIRPTSLSLKWSTKLSRASLASMNEDGRGYGLIPALSDDVTGSITVSATAVSAAFPDRAEWTALCNTKPTWTISEA